MLKINVCYIPQKRSLFFTHSTHSRKNTYSGYFYTIFYLLYIFFIIKFKQSTSTQGRNAEMHARDYMCTQVKRLTNSTFTCLFLKCLCIYIYIQISVFTTHNTNGYCKPSASLWQYDEICWDSDSYLLRNE